MGGEREGRVKEKETKEGGAKRMERGGKDTVFVH